jgi:hypothetical protein
MHPSSLVFAHLPYLVERRTNGGDDVLGQEGDVEIPLDMRCVVDDQPVGNPKRKV